MEGAGTSALAVATDFQPSLGTAAYLPLLPSPQFQHLLPLALTLPPARVMQAERAAAEAASQQRLLEEKERCGCGRSSCCSNGMLLLLLLLLLMQVPL